MRLMFLTNVAVAALAALCFRVGAQDSGPKLDQKKESPAAESNQAATSQKKNASERADRTSAEPMNPSVARPEMKSRGAAKQEMKSATGPAEKAVPGEAAKKRNADRQMQKSSAGKQPATAIVAGVRSLRSADYRKVLGAAGMIQSMRRKGNCWDNAPI